MTPSVPSPQNIARVVLSNGVVVLAYENTSSPSLVLGGYLWAGSLREAAEQAGLSDLTARMLMRGTAKRTFSQVNEALESAGAQLGFRSGVHTVGFGGKSLAEDLDLLLDVVADSLQHPTFPAEEAEKLRGQIVTGLRIRANDTQRMARLTFDALLYPEHPYGRSVQGYEETVSTLGQSEVRRYYDRCYSPAGMVVAVVGAVPAEAVVDKVQAALGGWQAPEAAPDQSLPPTVQLAEQRLQKVPIAGKTQSDVVLGWPAMAIADPDYMMANLANTVLGVFGMMGRLGDYVREEEGLAYYVYSQLEAGLGAGPWLTVAGVNPANVERTINGILRQVRHLREELVPAQELADSQSFLTGSMPLRLETNQGVLSAVLDMERYGLGLDYLQRYPGLVKAVTVEDVQAMAQKYLDPEAYALAIAGPDAE